MGGDGVEEGGVLVGRVAAMRTVVSGGVETEEEGQTRE